MGAQVRFAVLAAVDLVAVAGEIGVVGETHGFGAWVWGAGLRLVVLEAEVPSFCLGLGSAL